MRLSWRNSFLASAAVALPLAIYSTKNSNETFSKNAVSDCSFEDRVKKCNNLIRVYKNDFGIPAVIVGVSLNGETIYKKAFGYADVENNLKANCDTVMRIASISKPISCAVAAKFYENQKLDLDKSVNEYLSTIPKLKWQDKEVIVTARQLMCHTSGIRHYDKNVNIEEQAPEKKDTVLHEFYNRLNFSSVNDVLKIFINDKLIFEPGTNFLYSTHAYTLMTAVLESIAKKTFPQMLNELFKNLDMSQTYLDENDPLIANRAKYYKRDEKHRLKNVPYVNNSNKWAGGGLLSNIGDLLKFGNHLLACYQYDNLPGGLLQKETMEKLVWSKQSTPVTKYKKGINVQEPLIQPSKDVSYGLGWYLVFNKSKSELEYVYHTGGAVGCVSCLLIAPSGKSDENNEDKKPKGLVVSVLCNSDSASEISNLTMQIARIFTE